MDVLGLEDPFLGLDVGALKRIEHEKRLGQLEVRRSQRMEDGG